MIHHTNINGLTILEIENPPVNVLTMKVLQELRKELHTVKGKSLLIKSRGKCFSAGTDINEHLPGKVEEMMPLFTQTILDILSIPIPTTTYIHGATLGGGFELTLASDFLIANPDTTIALPEISLNCFPPVGAALLPERIGLRRALDLILSGEEVDPPWAEQIGLLNRIGTSEDAEEFAMRFTEFSSPALVSGKKAALQNYATRLRKAEEIYLQELMIHSDPVEGIQNFRKQS